MKGFDEGFAPDGVPTLTVTGPWSAAAAQAFDGSQRLILNYTQGFEPTIEFLSDLPVRRLSVLDWWLRDLSPLYHLTDTLEELTLTAANDARIDLSQFPHLSSLRTSWIHMSRSWSDAPLGLVQLTLGGYREANLSSLQHLESLESLELSDRPRVESLGGLAGLRSLRQLEVHGASRLVDVNALRGAPGDQLERLVLNACRRVPDLEPIGACRSLRYLGFSECGEVPTLAPLAELHDLEELWMYGTTKVVDGDLSVLRGLPKLKESRLENRRHYHPRITEIEELVASRRPPGWIGSTS